MRTPGTALFHRTVRLCTCTTAAQGSPRGVCQSRVIERKAQHYLSILYNTFLCLFCRISTYVKLHQQIFAGSAYFMGRNQADNSFCEDQNSRENVAGFDSSGNYVTLATLKQDLRRTYFIFSSQNSSVSFSVVSCVILVPRQSK